MIRAAAGAVPREHFLVVRKGAPSPQHSHFVLT